MATKISPVASDRDGYKQPAGKAASVRSSENGNGYQPAYIPAAVAATLVFILYLITLAPSVAMWDTGEYMRRLRIILRAKHHELAHRFHFAACIARSEAQVDDLLVVGIRWIESEVHTPGEPFVDSAGEGARYVGPCQNLHSYHARERGLRESEQRRYANEKGRTAPHGTSETH